MKNNKYILNLEEGNIKDNNKNTEEIVRNLIIELFEVKLKLMGFNPKELGMDILYESLNDANEWIINKYSEDELNRMTNLYDVLVDKAIRILIVGNEENE